MADKAQISTVVREVLIGDRIFPLNVASVVVERLVGNGYGYNAIAYTATVVRETLVKEMPLSFATVVRETLVYRPQDNQTQARIANNFMQQVVQLRAATAPPSTVRSLTAVPSFRELVLVGRTAFWPRSPLYAVSLREQIMSRRIVAAYTHSDTSASGLAMQVLQSRTRVYVPVSMVYAATERQQVLQHRDTTPANQVRTTIRANNLGMQVLQSRVRSAVVIMTYAYVETLVMQVLVKNTRPAPISDFSVKTQVQLILQRHQPAPPGIDDRAGSLFEQVLVGSTPTAPFGIVLAASTWQQVVVPREVVMPQSMRSAAALATLVMQHRETFPPQYALGRQTYSLWEQVAQHRVTVAPVDVHSVSSAASIRLQFMLFRTTPKPWEVIDPSIGAHAATLSWLTMQRRVVPPPADLNRSRFVASVVGQVVLGDAFPAPPIPEPVADRVVESVVEQFVYRDKDWTPVSRVDARQVIEQYALGDNAGWIDPTVPTSTVYVDGLAQALAVGDTFPDPLLPHADAMVTSLVEVAAVGDASFPDPTIPQSIVDATLVVEFAALGDTTLPDPTIPLSSVTARAVASFCALHDPSLTGPLPGSAARALSVVQAVVVADKSLVGLPLRKGPRPVITVSMS